MRAHLLITKKPRPSRAEPSTKVSEQAQINYINYCRKHGLKVIRLLDFPRMFRKEGKNA